MNNNINWEYSHTDYRKKEIFYYGRFLSFDVWKKESSHGLQYGLDIRSHLWFQSESMLLKFLTV